VLVTEVFDPAPRPVEVKPQAEEFLDERLKRHRCGRRAVFVPTRKEVEQLAADIGGKYQRLTAAFYHGGEPIRVIGTSRG
jgi:superfamily II DNA helicase RecQ